eukprot:PhF_6_TR41711/c0_g1_i1/m.63285/K10771/APEX1; AP endonuclease 1
MPPKRARKADKEEEGEEVETPTIQRSGTITEESILQGTVPFVRATKDSDFDKSSMAKIICWNVAGLRAALRKNEKEFLQLFKTESPDVVCLQETKLQSDDTDIGKVPGYACYDSCSTQKKGYSGTRIYVKDGIEHSVKYGLGYNDEHEPEGRVITVTLPQFSVVNSYVPNSGMKLERLEERVQTWDPQMEACLANIEKKTKKPVIWTGDLNVAERDYDRYFATNYKAMQKCPGFTPEERASFRGILQRTNMVDSFRHLYPNACHAYSYWSARFGCKGKNQGWRLDYFVLSQSLVTSLVDTFMLSDHPGSDHCPLVLWMKK